MTPRLAAVLSLALAGCGPETPPAPVVKEPPTASTVHATAPPPASAAPPPTSTAQPEPPRPKISMTELSPTQGDLVPLLADQARRARTKGLVPVIEFYADWCAPCRVFQANMDAPEIAAALSHVHLVKLNLDDWHDKLHGTGFMPRSIPAFYLITDAGRPTGKMLDGDRWGKASPARMGEALDAFLRGASRTP